MRQLKASHNSSAFLQSLQAPSIATPILLAGIGSVGYTLINGSEFLAIMTIGIVMMLIPEFLFVHGYTALSRFSRWLKLQPLFSLGIILGLIAALIFGILSEPVHAQFFNGTEKWIEGTLLKDAGEAKGSLTTIFKFIINIVRFLFILYMVFSVVQVIQALRRDEDWGKLAQVPLMVFVAATVTDIAAGFILGDGAKP